MPVRHAITFRELLARVDARYSELDGQKAQSRHQMFRAGQTIVSEEICLMERCTTVDVESMQFKHELQLRVELLRRALLHSNCAPVPADEPPARHMHRLAPDGTDLISRERAEQESHRRQRRAIRMFERAEAQQPDTRTLEVAHCVDIVLQSLDYFVNCPAAVRRRVAVSIVASWSYCVPVTTPFSQKIAGFAVLVLLCTPRRACSRAGANCEIRWRWRDGLLFADLVALRVVGASDEAVVLWDLVPSQTTSFPYGARFEGCCARSATEWRIENDSASVAELLASREEQCPCASARMSATAFSTPRDGLGRYVTIALDFCLKRMAASGVSITQALYEWKQIRHIAAKEGSVGFPRSKLDHPHRLIMHSPNLRSDAIDTADELMISIITRTVLRGLACISQPELLSLATFVATNLSVNVFEARVPHTGAGYAWASFAVLEFVHNERPWLIRLLFLGSLSGTSVFAGDTSAEQCTCFRRALHCTRERFLQYVVVLGSATFDTERSFVDRAVWESFERTRESSALEKATIHNQWLNGCFNAEMTYQVAVPTRKKHLKRM
jgi:hypothetical protein